MQKQKPSRKAIRLKQYDYSAPGKYFVTICAIDKMFIFGEINNTEMILNESGRIMEKVLLSIADRFTNVEIDVYSIMPNHVHLIISILPESESVARAIHELPLQDAKYRRRMSLPKIIGYLKMNSAKQINRIKDNSGSRVWQRNYYEHIMRNEKTFDEIYAYIQSNPLSWDRDMNHPDFYIHTADDNKQTNT